jgi:hypothetical protein
MRRRKAKLGRWTTSAHPRPEVVESVRAGTADTHKIARNPLAERCSAEHSPAMPTARRLLVDPAAGGVDHSISRCVRRAILCCGQDQTQATRRSRPCQRPRLAPRPARSPPALCPDGMTSRRPKPKPRQLPRSLPTRAPALNRRPRHRIACHREVLPLPAMAVRAY